MTGVGDNVLAGDMLRSLVSRIERLKGEQDSLGEDIKEIYAEAKSNGFDKTALGQVITIRRKRAKDPQAFEERSATVDLYLSALDGTVDANIERAPTHAHVNAPKATRSGKPSPEAGPQAEASQAGTGRGMPAGHVADRDGVGANAHSTLPDGLTIDEHGVVQPPDLRRTA